ncbi:MAG: GTPase Era [Alphaproteobacteria bacterium]
MTGSSNADGLPEDAGGGTRAGFVAILGSPNAGKSTLLNALVGAHIAIVTPKVQTTRTRMTGICMAGDTQIAFVDTPGIFQPKRRLDRAMVAAAWSALDAADAVVLVVDSERAAKARTHVDPETAEIAAALKTRGVEAILVLNKIDLVVRESLLAIVAAHDAAGRFTRVFMVSARNGDGVEDLKAHLAAAMPSGPWLYPPDQLSDAPMRLLAAEITREQAFLQLHQELPYGLTVENERWEERDDGSARIDQVILVARETHKGMVVGKRGARIKAIGEAARHRIEDVLGRRVHLFLHVKVKPDWMERSEHYREIGLDFQS